MIIIRDPKKIDSGNTPVFRNILAYNKAVKAVFHMPGHKLGKGLPEVLRRNAAQADLTEIPGMDNLHHPEGVIREAQEKAAAAFGADRTYFLVNGSTSGIYAMIGAICRPLQKLIVSRECHKAVINGMAIAGVEPLFIFPGENFEIRMCTLLDEYPEAAGALVTRPDYYGICKDIGSITTALHSRGKVLMVDEAHGAHLRFSRRLPECAMDAGADICVQSAHKTLPAFTQAAYLHIRGSSINLQRLENLLSIHQTSSPSYIIMASLDIAREIMEKQGEFLLGRLLDNISWFAGRLMNIRNSGIELQTGTAGCGMTLDPTRLVIYFRNTCINGIEAARLLWKNSGVSVEMAETDKITCIATIADKKSDFNILYKALRKLPLKVVKEPRGLSCTDYTVSMTLHPERIMTLSDAACCAGEKIRLDDAEGRICASIIAPYPPGIPLLCPGEIITGNMINSIKGLHAAGILMEGLDSATEGSDPCMSIVVVPATDML